jgi:hypothetical protein
MNPVPKYPKKFKHSFDGRWLALGVAFGAALGVVLGALAVSVGIGATIGISAGAIFGSLKAGKTRAHGAFDSRTR